MPEGRSPRGSAARSPGTLEAARQRDGEARRGSAGPKRPDALLDGPPASSVKRIPPQVLLTTHCSVQTLCSCVPAGSHSLCPQLW